jgi:hypothetical protein
MPEVAIFEGAPNAFATGAFRDSSLVAVSTGLLESMTREEVEAVIGHEVAHVANGDMVTLTLIQGVVNTFVIFMARVVGYFVDKVIFKTERGVGPGFMITVFVCEIIFGILASIIVAWFSRQREFRADAGSAAMMGSPRSMIGALRRLGGASRRSCRSRCRRSASRRARAASWRCSPAIRRFPCASPRSNPPARPRPADKLPDAAGPEASRGPPLALVVVVTVLAHAAFNGSRLTISLYALSLNASPLAVGMMMSLFAAAADGPRRYRPAGWWIASA